MLVLVLVLSVFVFSALFTHLVMQNLTKNLISSENVRNLTLYDDTLGKTYIIKMSRNSLFEIRAFMPV